MFQQAFSDMLMKQMDPMNGIMQQMATSTVQTQDIQVQKQRAAAILEIRQQVKQAHTDKEPQSVIDALERILKNLST